MLRICVVFLSLTCALQCTYAQPIVTKIENVPGSMSSTVTYRSGSCGTNDQLYDVVLSTTSAFTGGAFTISRGSSCNGLGDVTFNTAGSGLITLEIGSPTGPMRNVLSIDGTTTTLPVRIYLLHTIDLGRVEVNRIETAYAHRTLNGPINILNRSGYSTYTIDRINVGSVGVQGSILGDVINNYGTIG